jgi:methyl-accepting chemotaxis protein
MSFMRGCVMISKLRDMRIETKLFLICGTMLAGFIVFGLITLETVAEIEVNGPLYHRITRGKNLIADVLPPPAYILESYLTLMQLKDEVDPGKRALLFDKIRSLRKTYFGVIEFWRHTLPDGPMKDLLVMKSYEPAVAFYKKFEDELIPAIIANDSSKVNSVTKELGKLYQIHRKAIDEVVRQANNSNSADEVSADSIIRRRELLLYTIAFMMIAAIAASLFGVRKILTDNVVKLVSVTKRFQSGDLAVRTGLSGKDEFSEVGRAFDQMAEKIERDSLAIAENEENLKRINGQLRQEIVERKQTEDERNRLIDQLRVAISRIKTLTGLLPVCSACKKIKNDNGEWQQMEEYIRNHTEADFSHGICPECMEKLYPDYILKTSLSSEDPER